MAFENLSDRERDILQNLIDHYIQTADPVGSRVIANKYSMGLSPATIRNTMQDLEEMGLISQPHTSAGRVPTDAGYRVFVDMLLKPAPLSAAEKTIIQQMISSPANRGIDTILGQASKVLGEITNQLGITVSPKFEKGVLTGIDLIPVADGKILLVVAVKSGLARTILLEVESKIEISELRMMESVLNERLAGLTLGQIKNTLTDRLSDTACAPKLIKMFIDSDAEIWSGEQKDKLHITGTDNLIIQPEFADRERLTDIIKLLEEKKALKSFMESKATGEGIIITIGNENTISEIRDCSLVTSSYKIGKISGTIGVIGPTRMPYSKLVSIVQYTARSLTDALSDK
ncbi:MAG: heat-inducible transcription repressor HrcA [candidate division Zixibacteria bacterium]|nr:heat-inducible transcription repressor HrcA [candidate division Zixibacteria bacterium]